MTPQYQSHFYVFTAKCFSVKLNTHTQSTKTINQRTHFSESKVSLRGGTTKQSAEFQQSASCLKNDCKSLADCFTRCARSQRQLVFEKRTPQYFCHFYIFTAKSKNILPQYKSLTRLNTQSNFYKLLIVNILFQLFPV